MIRSVSNCIQESQEVPVSKLGSHDSPACGPSWWSTLLAPSQKIRSCTPIALKQLF